MVVYQFDKITHEMIRNYTEPDDYQLGSDETTVKPADGLYQPLSFDEVKQTWSGMDPDAFIKAHPVPEIPATNEQQSITALAIENATLKQQITQMQQSVTALAQVAPVTAGGTK